MKTGFGERVQFVDIVVNMQDANALFTNNYGWSGSRVASTSIIEKSSLKGGIVDVQVEHEVDKKKSRMERNITTKVESELDNKVCPRCKSNNTRFCYYNNSSKQQPRYYCRVSASPSNQKVILASHLCLGQKLNEVL